MREWEVLTKKLVEDIKNTEVYKNYELQCDALKDNVELRRQINQYRKDTYEFQNCEEDIFSKLDEYERKYAAFRANPKVENYLQAELAVVRMIQSIYDGISEAVDLELDEE